MRPKLETVTAILALALAGCAHALRQTPSLEQVTGGARGHTPSDVERLLAQAEEQLASREPSAVRRAAETFSIAAAADTSRTEGLVGSIRARVWITEHDADAGARQEAATRAVQAAQWCAKIAPGNPACDYWLGAALGVQARERPSTGLSALKKIEQAFENAARKAPELDEAGPDRALALFFVRAPGWPAGPGDPEQALAHARRAVELKPAYPPNLLALGEALAATGDTEGSRKAYARSLELARSREESGDKEATEWIEEAKKHLST